jgi:hypothetical protein
MTDWSVIMEQLVQVSQPETCPSGTERYLRLVRPVVRGCCGMVAAVAVFAAAGAIGGRGGLALASGYLAFLGSYCLLNFRQCRETHCVITGPGWTLAALLGFAAAASAGSAPSWYGVTGESIAAIAICVLGYGLEWQVAARNGRRALRKGWLHGEARRN